jgi:hypothetical protein
LKQAFFAGDERQYGLLLSYGYLLVERGQTVSLERDDKTNVADATSLDATREAAK